VLPPIDDDSSVEFKNALALRNAASVAGTCPACGAIPELNADPEQSWVSHLVFRHESWRGALTDEAA
jgi:hypothetical protein